MQLCDWFVSQMTDAARFLICRVISGSASKIFTQVQTCIFIRNTSQGKVDWKPQKQQIYDKKVEILDWLK